MSRTDRQIAQIDFKTVQILAFPVETTGHLIQNVVLASNCDENFSGRLHSVSCNIFQLLVCYFLPRETRTCVLLRESRLSVSLYVTLVHWDQSTSNSLLRNLATVIKHLSFKQAY